MTNCKAGHYTNNEAVTHGAFTCHGGFGQPPCKHLDECAKEYGMKKSKKKKKEEVYSLTPLGLLSLELGDDKAQDIMDALELVARRQGCNAMHLIGNDFVHITIDRRNVHA